MGGIEDVDDTLVMSHVVKVEGTPPSALQPFLRWLVAADVVLEGLL